MRGTYTKVLLEANSLWPARMSLNEAKQFLRGHTDTPWEKLFPLWEERKQKHVSYWRDRYGLDDARPFKMLPPQVGGSALLLPDGVVEVIIYQSSPIKITAPDPEQALKRYLLSNSSLKLAEPLVEGRAVPLVEDAKPEHDWTLWSLDLKWRAARRGIKVPTRRINKYVSQYKRGKFSSLEELERVILDSLK